MGFTDRLLGRRPRPRNASGYPSTFLRREVPRSKFALADILLGSPLTLQVPGPLQQSVANNATVETTQNLSLILTHLSFDIPQNVTGFIELDGERVHSTQDGDGGTGGIPFGDDATRQGRAVNRVLTSFTNTSGAARDCRYVLHGVPP